MAEATGLRNNALPYPIYGQQYTVTFPILDADGDLVTGASSLDSEISKNGDTFADCTNEATEIATSSGIYYLTLTATELTTDIASIIVKTATAGAKTTTITLYPRKLVTVRTGTCADDGSGTADVVLDASAKAVDDYYNGMVVCVVIDGAASAECRVITDYTGSTQTATVAVGFNTAVDNTDTFTIYLPEGALHGDSLYGDKIYSDTTNIDSVTSDIQSDTNVIITKLGEADTSDIISLLTIVNSRVLVVKSDTSDIVSNLAVADCSDVLSRLTVITSEGDISDILSRLTVTNSQLLIVKSDTSDIQSHLTAIDAVISDIQSDTNVMVPIVSDIQSDTNVIITKLGEADTSDILSRLTVLDTRTKGVVLFNGTIGDTGNSTTAVHLPDLGTYGDDELNNYMLVVRDVSEAEYHVRTIADWETTGNTATVATLPFTPENSVDTYWLLSEQPTSISGGPLTSDQDSKLTRVANAIVEVDTSDILSMLTVVRDNVSDIQSDTNKLVSDATEVDTSDILSLLTIVNSRVLVVKSDTSDIVSNLTAIEGAAGVLSDISSKVTRIHSDTITLASDLAEGDFSDILSRLTVTNSQLLIVKSDTSDIRSALVIVSSDTAHIESQTTRIHSDTITLASDLAEGDFSDILSRLTVTNSQLLIVKSDTSDIRSALVIIASDAAHVESKAVQIYSDTTHIDSDTTHIESDAARIDSATTVIKSELLIVKSDTSDIKSQLVTVASDTAAVETKTASLNFTVGGQVDANIQSVNDVAVTGTGQSGDEWGPV